MVDRSELDLLYDRMKELRFGVAMCSITILRYLSGAAGRLHICVVTRIIQHHDFIEMLVPLLENPPWVRDRDGTREIRDGTHWKAVSASDRFQLTKIDAQVMARWLISTLLHADPCSVQPPHNDLGMNQLLMLCTGLVGHGDSRAQRLQYATACVMAFAHYFCATVRNSSAS